MKKSESRESSAIIKQEAFCEQEYSRTTAGEQRGKTKGAFNPQLTEFGLVTYLTMNNK